MLVSYVIGVLALIVFFYRLAFIMFPMLIKAKTLTQVFNSFTLLV